MGDPEPQPDGRPYAHICKWHGHSWNTNNPLERVECWRCGEVWLWFEAVDRTLV